jgi:hypothetical protein
MWPGRILAKKLGKSHQLIFVTPRPQIRPSMTHMGQMTNPKPFIISKWTYQEMMAWIKMKLIGSIDVI